MTPDQLAELKDNAILRKRLAKRMARDCFRNTEKLENLHAAGQIDQQEMKDLMIDVVDYCNDFLIKLCSPHGAEIIDDLKRRDKLPDGNDRAPMIQRCLPRCGLESFSRPRPDSV
jgi:hypothetical protein